MKALDHFTRGEVLEQEQAVLSAMTHPATIIGTCHAAAHHFVSAGVEWVGIPHERAGHTHTKHPSLLKDAGAPIDILEAWKQLEDARARGVYGRGASAAEVSAARQALSRIKGWAQARHP
jgi:hypothetical protein